MGAIGSVLKLLLLLEVLEWPQQVEAEMVYSSVILEDREVACISIEH